MSHQSVPASHNENVSCASPSAPVQSTSSGICIKQEYFEDQIPATVKTESESAPNQHNIMDSIKVEVKEEHYHDQDCPECLVKRELDFDQGGQQKDTKRDVKIGLFHPTNECSRSTTFGTSSSSVPPPPPVTHSTTIQANIKVEMDDSSTVQSVQLCKGVKKEEDDGREYLLECDCKECIVCKVKREIKEEFDQSGCESELGANSAQPFQGYTRVKKEEENSEGESERPNKIQRMDRVVENVPVGSPSAAPSTVHSSNGIPINVKFVDDQVATASTNSFTIQDHTQPSQPVTFPLPTPIVTPPQSASSAQHFNELLRDGLFNTVQRMDNVVYVDAEELDREQIDQEDEEDGDQLIEGEDTRADGGQQVLAENFVKQIEPADELGNRFVCDYRGCGKRTKRKSDLIVHIRRHIGEKPFKCSVAGCDRAYFQKCNLDDHFRTHTGQRPFVCETCNATFAYHRSLVIHLRTHTGTRPFVCTWPDCGQAFISSSHLHSHSQVHSNERQFVCDVMGCTKVYKHKVALRRHQKTQHN